jgi:hypothetical protein
MTQVCYASTIFGAMTMAVAIDAGRLGPADQRRVLLVSNNAAIPEIVPAVHEIPAFAVLRDRFAAVHSWNDILFPMHPAAWTARALELPMLGRLVADRLVPGGEPTELVLESIAVPPARTLAALIRDCPITVYADGLMSHGPTRDPLPVEISSRITRLLHLDLVPGVPPLLLTEYGVPAEPVPAEAFREVIAEVVATAPDTMAGDALILGQYLSALGILTAAEEAELHATMLRGVAARGHRRIVFKPHPTAGRGHVRRLRETADELGVQLTVAGEDLPAEAYFATLRPELVVGCFSTALTTARRFFDLPVATVGGELVLERLAPYENSNRIPATIADALLPRLSADGTITDPPPMDVAALVRAVTYCMQSTAHPGLRPDAEAFITRHGPDRYFKRRRLRALDLMPPEEEPAPDSPPPPPPPPPPSRAARLRKLLHRNS